MGERRGPARVLLNGRAIGEQTADGHDVVGDSFVLLLNPHHEPIEFTLPSRRFGVGWVLELSTEDPDRAPVSFPPRGQVSLVGRSLAVLRQEA